LPVAYVPFRWVDAAGAPQPKRWATFVVRTAGPNPMALAATLRREVARTRTDFHVINLQTQQELDESHTIRERLLARLALFFALIALLLAGVGLYGILDYSVLQRRREIGIRLAVGASCGSIGRLVTVSILAMVALGTLAGLLLGITSVRFIDALLYQAKPSEPMLLAFPVLSILTLVVLAGVPAVVRALGINPAETLRSE
jgi:ABC-type lipoprotein release transport system permease subunit